VAISFPLSGQAIPCDSAGRHRVSDRRIRGVPPRVQLPTPPPAPPSGRGASGSHSVSERTCRTAGRDAKWFVIARRPQADVAISFPLSGQAIPCDPADRHRVSDRRIRGVPPRVQLPTPPPAPPSGRGATGSHSVSERTCRTAGRDAKWFVIARRPQADVTISFPLSGQAIPCDSADRHRVSDRRIRGVPPRVQLPTPPLAPPSGRGATDGMLLCPSFLPQGRRRCKMVCHCEETAGRRGNLIPVVGAGNLRFTINRVTLRRAFRSDVRVSFPASRRAMHNSL